jgi:hypothetical protein
LNGCHRGAGAGVSQAPVAAGPAADAAGVVALRKLVRIMEPPSSVGPPSAGRSRVVFETASRAHAVGAARSSPA